MGTAGAQAVAVVAPMWACTPTLKIVPPAEPIVINLNIKIEQEIRIRIDSDLENLLGDEEGLF